LAAQQLFHIPTWATLGSSQMPYVEIPYGVRVVHLFVDNDPAGLDAMAKATRRYTARGYNIGQWVPPTCGEDWNDYLKGLKQDE
jgi:putative DNA primase/helicase